MGDRLDNHNIDKSQADAVMFFLSKMFREKTTHSIAIY